MKFVNPDNKKTCSSLVAFKIVTEKNSKLQISITYTKDQESGEYRDFDFSTFWI